MSDTTGFFWDSMWTQQDDGGDWQLRSRPGQVLHISQPNQPITSISTASGRTLEESKKYIVYKKIVLSRLIHCSIFTHFSFKFRCFFSNFLFLYLKNCFKIWFQLFIRLNESGKSIHRNYINLTSQKRDASAQCQVLSSYSVCGLLCCLIFFCADIMSSILCCNSGPV